MTRDSVETSGSQCTIWQAARATSAAATFFDPIQIGNQEYVDGATGFNNPVEVVLEEARAIWPDATPRIQCLVSIGTGVPGLRDFGDSIKELVMTLKSIATGSEDTEKRFCKNHTQLGLGGRFFRFNVDQGLAEVRLDEYQKINIIEAATESYLESPRLRTAIDGFLAARAQNDGKQHVLGPPHTADLSLTHILGGSAGYGRAGGQVLQLAPVHRSIEKPQHGAPIPDCRVYRELVSNRRI